MADLEDLTCGSRNKPQIYRKQIRDYVALTFSSESRNTKQQQVPCPGGWGSLLRAVPTLELEDGFGGEEVE